MGDCLQIPYSFIEQYVRFTRPEHLQIYFYARYLYQKDGEMPSTSQLAKALGLQPDAVAFSLDYWLARGELAKNGDAYAFPDTPQEKPAKKPRKGSVRRQPSYTMEEIDGVCAANSQVSELLRQAETILQKQLTQSDLEMLYSFHDWLGLPVEVIIMLLTYAAKRGKTTKRYLETVAMDWADKGIDTYEAAEAYVSELEALDSYERQARSILGIYDRALTQTERKYLKQWCTQRQTPPELIQLAYDKTVANTGKLSWAYMNKLIVSWMDEGLTTRKQVEQKEEQYRQAAGGKPASGKPVKKTKFNNYEDTNKIDYAALEEKLLDMMLEQSDTPEKGSA